MQQGKKRSESIKIVKKYCDDNPEETHQKFIILVHDALYDQYALYPNFLENFIDK